MPVIPTKTNHVVAHEVGDDGTHVQVQWTGPAQGGRYAKQFHGPLLPAEYDEAVSWARGLADQLCYPLHVVPMTGAEALQTEQIQRGVAGLTDQQRGELRQEVAATMAVIMRDSDDPDVRWGAHEVLVNMGVVK